MVALANQVRAEINPCFVNMFLGHVVLWWACVMLYDPRIVVWVYMKTGFNPFVFKCD